MAKPQIGKNFSYEELNRMEAHIREALARSGMPERSVNQDAVAYMAHFLHETHIAPTDSSMALAHRVTAWCMEAMNG
jgi:hypothetical protein